MLTGDDLKKHAALKSIITQANYNLKGDAIMTVASLFKWFDDLAKPMTEPKIIDEPIKKMEGE